MKKTTKTSRTAGYLEKIFRALNNDSFGGATLPEGGRMIEDIIKQVRKAAMELNMEVDELLEWLRAENNKKFPWEE